MKIDKIIKTLERKGYKVTKDLNTGNVLATKYQHTYKAESYSALFKQINAPLI